MIFCPAVEPGHPMSDEIARRCGPEWERGDRVIVFRALGRLQPRTT
jgi:hypothetical protein